MRYLRTLCLLALASTAIAALGQGAAKPATPPTLGSALDRQVSQKLLDMHGPEVARVPLAVEDEEAPRPIDVAVLGAERVVADA